jgi:CheY-like chemotaxis protein
MNNQKLKQDIRLSSSAVEYYKVLCLHHADTIGSLDLAALTHPLPQRQRLPLVMLSAISRLTQEESGTKGDFVASVSKPVKLSLLDEVFTQSFSREKPSSHPIQPLSSSFDPQLAQRLPVKILLAEDVMVNQKVALHLLKRLGYHADVANDGKEVLEALRRQPYDVVFMDVQMPEMDGLEATHRICQEWSPLHRPWIIAMTANSLRGDRETCLRAGMNDYISKPIRIEALVEALNTYEQFKNQASIQEVASMSVTVMPEETTQQTNNHLIHPPALDTQKLQALKHTVGGDSAFLTQLVDCYLEEALQQLQAMREAVVQGDASTLHKSAHSLKAISVSLGAVPLAQLCQALEVMGYGDRTLDASRLISQLNAEYERVKAALHLEYPRRQR